MVRVITNKGTYDYILASLLTHYVKSGYVISLADPFPENKNQMKAIWNSISKQG